MLSGFKIGDEGRTGWVHFGQPRVFVLSGNAKGKGALPPPLLQSAPLLFLVLFRQSTRTHSFMHRSKAIDLSVYDWAKFWYDQQKLFWLNKIILLLFMQENSFLGQLN